MKSHRREMSEETRKGKYFPLTTNRFPTNSQPESTHSAIENILRNVELNSVRIVVVFENIKRHCFAAKSKRLMRIIYSLILQSTWLLELRLALSAGGIGLRFARRHLLKVPIQNLAQSCPVSPSS